MILDGKITAARLQSSIQKKISLWSLKPKLAVILVGDNLASQTYVNRKVKTCLELGIMSKKIEFDTRISEDELLNTIESLNQDPTVNGILVQLPLPKHISDQRILRSIEPYKDVDGFHPINKGLLSSGSDKGFVPCTPLGIRALLEAYDIKSKGKHVVIVGRSEIVGKPLASLFLLKGDFGDATVTICHSNTSNLEKLTATADILIAAIGKPNFIKSSMVKAGAIVIDVGINRVLDKLTGDVDFESVSKIASWITPVPGGVGPMTIAGLMLNTVRAYEIQHSL